MTVVIAGHTVTPSWVAAAAVIAAASITLASVSGVSGWLVAAGLIGPDLAFLAAIGTRPTAPGRMPRRVVPIYNLLHRPLGPALVGALSAVLLSPPLGVLALAWLAHIVWDRSVGYGLRDREGAVIAPRHPEPEESVFLPGREAPEPAPEPSTTSV